MTDYVPLDDTALRFMETGGAGVHGQGAAEEIRALRADLRHVREVARALEDACDYCPICAAARRGGRLEHGLSCNVGRVIVATQRRGGEHG